jgi:hypothetical protein
MGTKGGEGGEYERFLQFVYDDIPSGAFPEENRMKFIRFYPIRYSCVPGTNTYACEPNTYTRYSLVVDTDQNANWPVMAMADMAKGAEQLYPRREGGEVVQVRPWWYIAQAFGRGDTYQKTGWELPNKEESMAMMHVALAYGARGLFAYTLQQEDILGRALVDHDLVEMPAEGDSYPADAYRCMAQHIDPSAQTFACEGAISMDDAYVLFDHLPASDFSVATDQPEVIATARASGARRLVYVVNLDVNQRDVQLSLVGASPSCLVDLYSGAEFARTEAVALDPGQGRFLELSQSCGSQ